MRRLPRVKSTDDDQNDTTNSVQIEPLLWMLLRRSIAGVG